MNDPKPVEDKCPSCSEENVCQGCIEKLRAKGIPERTLEWFQLDKMKRIETVMF